MANSDPISRKLKALTPRQSQILYLVCTGLTYPQVAEKLFISQYTVQSDMTKVYKIFGMTDESMPKKRQRLGGEICPIHLQEFIPPDTAIDDSDDPDPPGDKEIGEVILDAQEGLIPIRALMVVPPVEARRESPPPPPRPNAEAPHGATPPPRQSPVERIPIYDPMPPRNDGIRRLLLLAVGLGTLLLFACLVIVFLLLNPRSSPPTAAATSVATLIVKETVLVPITVPAPPGTVASVAGSEPTVALIGQLPTQTSPAPTNLPTPKPEASPTVADQQNPPPGSEIPAGQGYTKNGVTVTFDKKIDIADDNDIALRFTIKNSRTEQLVIRWRNSYLHLQDDQGRIFPQNSQDATDWDDIKQFTIDGGRSADVLASHCCTYYNQQTRQDFFHGEIDPNAKYLIFTIDQIAGMQNLTWRLDLQ